MIAEPVHAAEAAAGIVIRGDLLQASGGMRRVRAAILMFTALLVLAAGIVPACAEVCCKRAGTPTVHAQMPCCEPSLAQRDARVDPATAATFAVSVPQSAALALVAEIEPRPESRATTFVGAAPVSPPAPPLFLLHDQFLI